MTPYVVIQFAPFGGERPVATLNAYSQRDADELASLLHGAWAFAYPQTVAPDLYEEARDLDWVIDHAARIDRLAWERDAVQRLNDTMTAIERLFPFLRTDHA